jgi:surface antigen
MTVNQQVLAFASSKIGQTVGGGECYDLANAALQAANAQTAADYGEITPDADYQWGLPVITPQPGDIIQFRNYSFRIDYDDGWEEQSRPHHTAIVASVGANGAIMVYEQNVGTGSSARTVQHNQLYFENTSAVTVSGQFWFYRPQPNE